MNLGLNLDLSDSSLDQGSKPSVSRRKKVSPLSSLGTSAAISSGRRRRKSQTSQLPSLAMETLGGSSRSRPASKKSRRTTTTTKTSSASTNVDIKDILRDSVTIREKKA